MGAADDKLMRPILVPPYLVYGSIALICVLSGGPIGQVVMLSHHVYKLQDRQIEDSRNIAAQQVKQDDLVHAIQSMSADIKELTRSVTVLNSRMPE